MFTVSEKALELKNSSKSKPGQGAVVLALCPFIETLVQPHPSGNGTVTYQILRCPRRDACSIVTLGDRGRIKVIDKAGYTNPYKHILKCVFANNADDMLDAYWETQVGRKRQALMSKYTSVMPSSLPLSFLLSKEDLALFEWVEMIVMENWPLSTVENRLYRKALKQDYKFSKKRVRSVIIAMTCSVETILAAEMKEAGKGSIVHDAWSKFGAHYFALFTTYIATRETDVNGVATCVTQPVISLISVAPLHTPVKEGINSDGCLLMSEEAEVEESADFTAEAHFHHITDILMNFYDINEPKNWITNQTADSASVNLKLARLLHRRKR